MIKISVSASKKYHVILEAGAIGRLGSFLAEAGIAPEKKLCIVTDETVNRLYGKKDDLLWTTLESSGFDLYKFVFPGGESTKNMETISRLLEFLADNRFSRSDVLIAFGGGIVGDVTGFAAASYMRGVEFVQLPTTLLATVDSSVGGKTGVNLSAGKNLAGAFWQPSLVVFDPNLLSTLQHHTILDGIAEAVKAGFIGDITIPNRIKAYLDSSQKPSSISKDTEFLTELAACAVEVKKKIVEEDEHERGKRQLLNFGHTLAHAIEKCSGYEISHGHAVAKGMALVSAAADSLGWSNESCTHILLDILKGFDFPLDCPFSPEELTAAALQDKKIRGSHITLVLPDSLGSCFLKTISIDNLLQFIKCAIDALPPAVQSQSDLK